MGLLCSPEIFWLLSGFIFYTVYFDDIQNRKIGFGEYLMLRLSRLYPLHLLTLISVGIIQFLYIQKTHIPFWYDTQDVKHLIPQLFFVQEWSANFKQSYNIPAWSVSIEIFVYILFFLVVASGIARNKNIYLIFACSVFFYSLHILDPFSECMVFFFGGNIVAKAFMESRNRNKLFLLSACISIVALLALLTQKKFFREAFDTIILTDLVLLPVAGTLLLTLILGFKKIHTEKLVRLFKNLGDLTYATYMLHYSVIAAIVLFVNAKDITFYDQD
ncbi:MAG: acyltransferase [Chryseolinea sp.]